MDGAGVWDCGTAPRKPALTLQTLLELALVVLLAPMAIASPTSRPRRTAVADYGYVLETGEIVLNGPSAEPASNPRMIESYLCLVSGKAV